MYQRYLVNCVGCQANTSKAHAREHNGLCKSCVTGGPSTCPDCGGPISRWKLAKGYHCSDCTRDADPEGYVNEVMGYQDYQDSN